MTATSCNDKPSDTAAAILAILGYPAATPAIMIITPGIITVAPGRQSHTEGQWKWFRGLNNVEPKGDVALAAAAVPAASRAAASTAVRAASAASCA
jgi:hypothetical protein